MTFVKVKTMKLADTLQMLETDDIFSTAVLQGSQTFVAARYSTDAGETIPNDGNLHCVDFYIKQFDTHSAVTVGADWKFTAPLPGKYQINVAVLF
jgi:hypothetical protein